jgi:peroxiredoxin
MKTDNISKKLLFGVPWLMVLVLATTNLLLLRQNLKMRSSIEGHRPSALQTGDKVESFSAQALTGDTVHIGYTGKEVTRVLLYFSPDCPYCHEQFAYWQELLKKVNGNNFQVIGMIGESEDKSKVKDYLQKIGCQNLRVVVLPGEARQSYKLSMTPTTLVIANDGTVEKSWVGQWNSTIASEASSVFGVQFSNN